MYSNVFKKFARYFKYKKLIKSNFWFKKLRWYGISYEDVDWSKEKQCVHLLSLGIYLIDQSQVFILDAYNYLIELKKTLDFNIKFNEQNQYIMSISGFIFLIESKQEILIIKEVLAQQIYGYNIKQKSTLIDIGFNVGISSLYFSKNKNVDNVYSFEPFAPTLEKGLRNLELNPQFAGKIKTFNYGLSEEEKSEEILYDYEKKGSISTEYDNTKVSKGKFLKINLKPASLPIAKIIDSNSDKYIICKIDCEGSEFGIIQNLYENDVLGKIHVFMIEYHFKKPDLIIDTLDKSGFTSFVIKASSEIGMIYSVNVNR